jgi:hypothetical protein
LVSTSATSLIFASNDEVDVAASRLATSLSVAFSLHESSFRGGEYLMAEAGGGEQVIVQRNQDDDEPAEDVDAPTIVYVDGHAQTVRGAGSGERGRTGASSTRGLACAVAHLGPGVQGPSSGPPRPGCEGIVWSCPRSNLTNP